MTLRVRSGAALVAVAGATVLAGCGTDDTRGSASAAQDSAAESAPQERDGREQDGPPSFTNKQLCELLTEQEARGLSVDPRGEPTQIFGEQACEWSGKAVSFDLSFNDKNNVSELTIGERDRSSDTRINGRTALLIEYGDVTSCAAAVDLSESSMLRASVSVLSAGEGKLNECDLAEQAATKATEKISE
ncbi:uncharacterized protein DUF3558 [Tamaricihabitans halophyticus]|uniref:Uncharacterized protein DUF3558 n=1 Tax=Tamaricihabitans halophyticus TaxID=1262583 RepID=A0A4R2R3Y8_9PSEU|nr:DUF3558 family protein [Tamaricihabitans halophyticus]TCP56737.1 uncharacterized protein DUF3558 [Tamaricihabitans halophyticus]